LDYSIVIRGMFVFGSKDGECKVPALSEYRMEEINFENRMIKKMELLVMKTLNWKLGSITPFAYLHYFINKFCGESRPKGLVSRAVELIVAITRGKINGIKDWLQTDL
jgi:cyclin D5